MTFILYDRAKTMSMHIFWVIDYGLVQTDTNFLIMELSHLTRAGLWTQFYDSTILAAVWVAPGHQTGIWWQH